MNLTTDDAAHLWGNYSLLEQYEATVGTPWLSESPGEVDLTRAIPLGFVLGAFIVFAIVGNILVILAVMTNRHLRTPTNYFIINLAIADLLLGTTVLPVSATLEILNYWVFGRIFCDIWAAVDVLCCTASIMSLCVISIDRYIGVSHPLQYPSIVTEKRALLAMLGVWVLSVVISIGPLLGWKQPPSPDNTVCLITEEPFYALFSSLGSFYIPLVVILSMYFRVYVVAKRTTKNLEAGVMRERMNTSELTLRIHKGSQVQDDSSSTGKGRANQARSSLTVKLLKFSREKKAAKTLGVVVGMFTLCWLPFFLALPNASQATAAGMMRYKIIFPKAKKGGNAVNPVKTDPIYCYVDRLLDLLFNEITLDKNTTKHSRSRPVVIQPGIKPGSVMTPLALQTTAPLGIYFILFFYSSIQTGDECYKLYK
nr:alpha-1B adrenergic receptor-like isoform X2 [Oncorhynchus nerka]